MLSLLLVFLPSIAYCYSAVVWTYSHLITAFYIFCSTHLAFGRFSWGKPFPVLCCTAWCQMKSGDKGFKMTYRHMMNTMTGQRDHFTLVHILLCCDMTYSVYSFLGWLHYNDTFWTYQTVLFVPITCLYPLSHHIHITDEYLPKNLSAKVLWKCH